MGGAGLHVRGGNKVFRRATLYHASVEGLPGCWDRTHSKNPFIVIFLTKTRCSGQHIPLKKMSQGGAISLAKTALFQTTGQDDRDGADQISKRGQMEGRSLVRQLIISPVPCVYVLWSRLGGMR